MTGIVVAGARAAFLLSHHMLNAVALLVDGEGDVAYL